jgi:hypothetical protein
MGLNDTYEQCIFFLKSSVVYRNYKQQGILIDKAQKDPYGIDGWYAFDLNETGCFIIDGIKSEMMVKDIIQNLAKVYEIDYNTVKNDVIEFVINLEKIGLIYKK